MNDLISDPYRPRPLQYASLLRVIRRLALVLAAVGI